MSSKLRPFPNYRSEDKDAYQEVFKELAKEFGREQAEKGIVEALRDPKREGRHFVPAPPDFHAYVADARGYRPRFGAARDGCTLCHGDGWMTNPRKPGYFTKCDCRRIG
jgi:hypothetical protein